VWQHSSPSSSSYGQAELLVKAFYFQMLNNDKLDELASPTPLRFPARRRQNTAVMRWIVGVLDLWKLHEAKKERDAPQNGGAENRYQKI